jgi:hypothetical protein
MDQIDEVNEDMSDLSDSSPFDGRLEALNKWELANQLGSIAIHNQGNLASILIGQPGGTVLRITEISERSVMKKDNEDILVICKDSPDSNIDREDSVEKELPPGEEDHSV